MSTLNLNILRIMLENTDDVKYKEIICCNQLVTLVYIEGMTNTDFISNFIIRPFLLHKDNISSVEEVLNKIIFLSSATTTNNLNEGLLQIFNGNVLIFFSTFNEVITCEVKGFQFRNIEKSISESAVKGPQEAFVESLHVNISSIRRRIKTPDLKIENFFIGKRSKTNVSMLYLEGSTPKKLVSQIKTTLLELKKEDFVFYSNSLEEKLRCKWTPFDTIGYTEKPDIAASKIAEGKIVIIFDGSPFAVTAPYFFVENFMSTDDYTMNTFMGNIGRILRFLAYILSTFLPGFYIAIVTHHFRLIPSIFLFKIAILRAGVPVPTVIELLGMLFLFQIIREAAVRLPQPLGSTLSIVGALILGEAAVRSGLASQITVVVVGITSICSYLIPKIYSAVFTWNLVIIFFSATLGLPGFFTSSVVFIAHLANLHSCGYPFLYPMGTDTAFKFKDITYRGNLSNITNNTLKKEDEK